MSSAACGDRAIPWSRVAATVLVGATAVAASAMGWPIVVTVLVMPILEEVVFRAGVQQSLLDRGAPALRANAITAVVFTGAHLLLLGVTLQAALVFVPALVIGAAYGRWRRLGPCIALHIAMNGVWNVAQNIQ